MSSEKASFFDRLNQWVKQSVTLRLITIGILILLLLIPVNLIQSLIRERQENRESAIFEVSQKWGTAQTVVGPVLTVPYLTLTKVYNESNTSYSLVSTKEYAHFLPEQLQVETAVNPEMRYRGIYEVVVYDAGVKLTGKFNAPDFSEWKINNKDVLWDEAFVQVGLSDLRSIQNEVLLNLQGRSYRFNPGIETNDVIQTGISAKIDLDGQDTSNDIGFSFNLDLNGSTGINFIPVGEQTLVDVSSKWSDPSFTGAFLPDSREVDKNGFSANWKVLHLNRPYPQKFRGAVSGFAESAFGVDLIVPVDEYQKSMRSAKYAVMFITLTFLIFFFVQILNRVRVHPIQFIIVGLALCVFYTLLIALSEHVPFSYAYLISSVAVVSLITLYAQAIFKKRKLTLVVCLILTALYIFIFSIIQMEDYALLMGSIGLFLVLATVMYLSRKIDWYAVGNGAD